jgi:hypothetical protein
VLWDRSGPLSTVARHDLNDRYVNAGNARVQVLSVPFVAVADVQVCVPTLPSLIAAALLKTDPAFGQRQ